MIVAQPSTTFAESSNVVGSRYLLLSKIGDGGMGTVYSARDRLTGQTIALKKVLVNLRRLRPADESGGDAAAALLLAQEFKVLASLRHPHIVSVLDYGFDQQGQPFYTMTLLEGARSLALAARDCDFAGKLTLISEVLQALAYLHRRGILHRDLKPKNILVDHQGRLNVVDFGLAVTVDESNPRLGTIAYTAPEVLRGQPASVQSDLWSIGVIAYELLTGQRPFDAQIAVALVQKIIRQTLDLTVLANVQPLIPTIERLLAKSPNDRFTSAEEVIAALAQASGQPLPLETPATRESFLQASKFIGREVELTWLNEALQAAAERKGSVWLVGGESGVGKSRLLDELQTQALLRGAVVLRGQAIAQGGTPYQIWREAIRRLLLHTEMTDYELAVLKLILPDIGTFMEREIADLPQIDAHSRDLRLWSVIEHLFDQKQLTLLLLEDLHWADESLFILNWLSELAQSASLLIVGTYRDDEQPLLPTEFPGAHHIKLSRLSSESIAQLSASMLGEAGSSDSVLTLLERETEGNIFFMIEVLRTLAEEADGLANVGKKTLPDHVFAGGMQTVIQRRLSKVPQSARRLMTLAAAFNRELDLNILHVMMPEINLEQWLQQVATIIEVQDNRYRFAHDKLRDGILSGLEPHTRQQLHREIAQAIETAYPNSPEQYAALAYHWGQAQEATRTVQNATLAGEQALRSGSYRDAIKFFEQALSFTAQVSLDKTALSNLHYLLGDAYWGQSDMLKSNEWHVKTLRLLGFSVPHNRIQLILGSVKPLLKHYGRHLLHLQSTSQNSEQMLIAAASLHQITQVAYHDSDLALGIYCLFNGVNAAEQVEESPQAVRIQVRYYGTLGVAMGEVALHPAARLYFTWAERRLRSDPLPESQAWFNLLHSIYLSGRGQWSLVNPLIDKALHLSKTAGNLRLWVETIEFQVYILAAQGRFSDAMTAVESAGQVAIRDGHVQAIGRFHIAKARLLLRQGKIDEARTQYFDHEAAIEASFALGAQILSRVAANGVLIDLHMHNANWTAAQHYAEMLERLVVDAQSLSFILATEAAPILALYLTLWEKQIPGSHPQSVQAMFKVFHRKITRFHEIGHPVELVYRCWYHWLNGDQTRARSTGLQAIRMAKKYQMPYYEALAHYHLARFMPKESSEHTEHLNAAIALFDQTGCVTDAQCARDALLS